MKKITLTKGLIASGKTTWAKDQQGKNTNIVRVNKDDLRAMLHNGRYSKGNEKFVLKVRDFIIEEAINNHNDVIVDDTNFATKHKERIKQIVKNKALIEIKSFDVPLEECIKRDLQRKNSIGKKIIKSMYNQFIAKQEVIEKIDGLPKAIISDIDGTLAHIIKDGRSPFEFDRVKEDIMDENVEKILNYYRSQNNYIIILLSGRSEECRAETEEWLYINDIKYDYLYMRKEGDIRKDTIIKEELFDKYIRGKYNIDFILDDRDCVVQNWRKMGLICYQVAEGSF